MAGKRSQPYDTSITATLGRQRAETRRNEVIESQARALALLLCHHGSDHEDDRKADMRDADWGVADGLATDLPAIRAKLDREAAAVRHDRPQADEHGFTAAFLGAWLWRNCDAEGHLQLS